MKNKTIEEKEKLTSTASTDKSEVIELGDLILHQRGRVSQFRATVLVIARTDRHQSPVANFAKSNYFERHWKRLVGSPMRWQLTA